MDWSLLSPLNDGDRRELLSRARRRRFQRGDTVFHEGDPGDTLHLIERGHLAVRSSTPLGDVVMVRVIGPGGHFGEMAIIGPAPRSASLVALTDTETLSLHADIVNELRLRHPSIETMLLNALASEVKRLSAALVEALHIPADKRVLRRLLDLADVFDRHDDQTIKLPLTQDDVAELAGMTRPTANRVLRNAQDTGSIRLTRGRLEILDQTTLRSQSR